MINALGQPQRVLLLGGTSEIGLAIVRALATRDTRVTLAGRDLAALREAGDSLSASVAGFDTLALDASAAGDHAQLLGAAFASQVDVVIVAAGVLPVQADAMRDPQIAVASLAVNGLGATSLALTAHSLLARQGHGQLIVLSSIAAARPRPSNFIYGAGKSMLDFAVRGLVESPDPRVRVLLVRPGFVRSRMTAAMPDAPFATSTGAVGAAVARWSRANRGSAIVWVPPLLSHVSRILSAIPLALLRRIDR